jgi:cellobiose phosphorylase
MMKNSPDTLHIHAHDKLRSLVTPSGQGALFYEWVALTRFSEAAPAASGPVIYLHEAGSPASDDLSVEISTGIAPGVEIEVRKITVTNHSEKARALELTSYTEIALNHPLGDAGHPAFSKLFVQTSVVGETPILLARRRPRGMNENWPWMAQTLVGAGETLTWETNRATFLGRGRTVVDPIAMDLPGPLPCQTGNMLDSVMAFRTSFQLGARSSKTFWILTGAAADEAGVTELISNHQSATAAEALLTSSRASDTARLVSQHLTEADAARYEAMAAQMMFGSPQRAVPDTLVGSAVVHRHPLSWEEFRVVATADLASAGTQDLLAALKFWQSLGMHVRVFIMDASATAVPSGVVLVDPASFCAKELNWWLASAQLVVGADHFSPAAKNTVNHGTHLPSRPADDAPTLDEALQCYNGHGGFSADGREYVIPLPLVAGRLALPPMPWVNVLANPNFGCIVSERGAGYTWSRNSQANRLTPWSNDPISDPHGEAFYLKDTATGDYWSPLPGPCAARSAFVVRHGFGRTRFSSRVADISQTVEFLVPPEDSIKLVSIRLKNDSAIAKNLVFASFQRLLLCSSPDRHHATLAWTDADGVQHAENPRAGDFAGGRVFGFTTTSGVNGVIRESVQSASAFLGAGGVSAPSSLMENSTWDGGNGYGRDACFASKITFSLVPGAEIEIVVGLGEVMSETEEKRLLTVYRTAESFSETLTLTDRYWRKMLGGLTIKTPLIEVDLMVNGWLLYQNLACRIWGRSAFYQSGGAYGFRDQLQDSGAVAAFHPELMRSQILLHAAQQFPEGDVTHWWHPMPMGSGMRTLFADDLLWLPYLTDHYLQVTGDESVLHEICPFIEGPLLKHGEDEEYMKPKISETSASVFEHCCLALDKSLTQGVHGLPLMGIGDWNDGMSRIGREGKGESVWMGFFLITILKRWIPLCEAHGQEARAKTYAQYLEELLLAVNDTGWDGNWYRRAYYDDGTPLGTHTDDECRIDALAQAWAVISGAASPERMTLALDSLQKELVDPDYDIIRLLHPPFVNTPHDPGYIKGYVAGVRENGGQYTHAACWVIRAMAEAGRRDDAAKLLQRLSPIWHSRDAAAIARYQVEPYVVAADIYGAAPHVGRGGWTWYTGSAGWMFRVAVESVLGLRTEGGDTLVLTPCVPDTWPGYSIDFRTISGKTLYQIEVANPSGNARQVVAVEVDSVSLSPQDGSARWSIVDDGIEHSVKVTLGVSGG